MLYVQLMLCKFILLLYPIYSLFNHAISNSHDRLSSDMCYVCLWKEAA
jgi:hypothetical protein